MPLKATSGTRNLRNRHRLPPYVHAYIDVRGRERCYVRRPGFPRVPLPGLPYSAEFMAAYAAAMAAETAPRIEVGLKRSPPGSVGAAIAGYYGSQAFGELAAITRRARRLILDRFRNEYGQLPIATLKPQHIETILTKTTKITAKKNGKVNGGPSAAGNLLVALRGVIQFAIGVGLRGDDPTTGLHRPRATRRDGFYSWQEQDIERFEATFPVGTRERLALALLLETAQRRGDVIRMGWQHVRNGVITVRQSKTGKALQIPMSPTLAAALQATPSNNLPFLVTQRGTPFNATAFSDWFKRAVRMAGLPADASVHGLRKAAARRLAEAGCSANIIAAMTGHASLKEVARYTQAADQLRLARQGIEALAKTKGDQPKANIDGRLAK